MSASTGARASCPPSKETISVLEHTLRTGRYVTDELAVIELGKLGLLEDHGPQRLAGGMHYFTITAAGREALAAHRATLPEPEPLTRSQKRWQEYLDVAESYNGFGHWLRCRRKARAA